MMYKKLKILISGDSIKYKHIKTFTTSGKKQKEGFIMPGRRKTTFKPPNLGEQAAPMAWSNQCQKTGEVHEDPPSDEFPALGAGEQKKTYREAVPFPNRKTSKPKGTPLLLEVERPDLPSSTKASQGRYGSERSMSFNDKLDEAFGTLNRSCCETHESHCCICYRDYLKKVNRSDPFSHDKSDPHCGFCHSMMTNEENLTPVPIMSNGKKKKVKKVSCCDTCLIRSRCVSCETFTVKPSRRTVATRHCKACRLECQFKCSQCNLRIDEDRTEYPEYFFRKGGRFLCLGCDVTLNTLLNAHLVLGRWGILPSTIMTHFDGLMI